MRKRRNLNEKPTITADPNADYLSVYCAEDSHADRPWRIQTFYPERSADDSPIQWYGMTSGYQTSKSDVLLPLSGTAMVFLAEDRYLPPAEGREHPEIVSRRRFSLECETCGLRLTRTSEKMNPVLTRLRLGGLTEISLAVLIAACRLSDKAPKV